MEEIIMSINDFVNRSEEEIEILRAESISMAKSENVKNFINAYWDTVLKRKAVM